MGRNIAIIPARGGSKRIPRKNIRSFLGKPILSYSIETAIKSGLFDEIMVSTDDNEIVSIAENFGASVPFLRKEETSNDFAPLVDVLLEVLNEYNKRGEYFDNVCCILPTAPLITVDNIVKAYNIISTSDFDSVCPVVSFSYPILRSLCIDDSGKLKMNWPEYRYSRSQDLPLSYHDTGTFYWIKSKVLMEDKKIFAENGTAIVLDELQVQDIDTETDWALAEMKYRLMHKL